MTCRTQRQLHGLRQAERAPFGPERCGARATHLVLDERAHLALIVQVALVERPEVGAPRSGSRRRARLRPWFHSA